MYELILHAQVAAARQNQVLQILAGITAMQPVDIREQCLIYQQLKPAAATNVKKGAFNQSVAQQRLRYHKLSRDIENASSPSPWKLVVAETPDAGMKDANARTVVESVLDPATLERFQPGSGWYKYVLASPKVIRDANLTQIHYAICQRRVPFHPRERSDSCYADAWSH